MRRFVWLLAAAPALLGADDGCNADKSLGGNDPAPGQGVACGGTTCDAGQVCCDATCGVCAATQDACPGDISCPDAMCGSTTCGDGTACCNDTCCLPVGETCAVGACQGGTGGAVTCGEATCDGATEVCCMADGCTKCIPSGEVCNGQQCN